MSWFSNYFHKLSGYINWMEMLPNKQRYWQASLDHAFKEGKKQYRSVWNKQDTLGASGAKKIVFFQWWNRVSGPLTRMKNMVDDYVERTEGFRPLETHEFHEDTDVEIPSVDEFEKWWK